MNVFWRNGYQGTSLADLTAAMGISKPSLYAAFGDKQQLYLRALARYGELQASRHIAELDAHPDITDGVKGFLKSVADMLTAQGLPGGCFVVNGATDCGGHTLPEAVADALTLFVAQVTTLFRDRFAREIAMGHLPRDTDPSTLADFIVTLMSGMAVMAKAGTTRERLYATIDTAVRQLPRS